jgi:hypothetical protein
MGWVNDLKWAVKGVLAKKKKKEPEKKRTADRVSSGLSEAGLSQEDIDRLMGKKKKTE